MHSQLTSGLGFIESAVMGRQIRAMDHVVANTDKESHAASHDAPEDTGRHRRHVQVRADICDAETMRTVFSAWCPHMVMPLAAKGHVDRVA